MKYLNLDELRAGHEGHLRLQEVREYTCNDQDLLQLVQIHRTTRPQRQPYPQPQRVLWLQKPPQCLLVSSCCLFIPESHKDIIRSKDRAQLTVYWPDIDQDIEVHVTMCKLCQDSLSSHPCELISSNHACHTHSSTLLWTLHTSGANTFLLQLIASLTGHISSQLAPTPHRHTLSTLCMTYSVIQQPQISSGPMAALTIPRAIAGLSPPSKQ